MSRPRAISLAALGAVLAALAIYALRSERVSVVPAVESRSPDAVERRAPPALTLMGPPDSPTPTPAEPDKVLLQFLDESGRPVPECEVAWIEGTALLAPRADRLLGESDSAGRLDLDAVALGALPRDSTLLCRALGFIPLSLDPQTLPSALDAATGDRLVRVSLSRGQSISGSVVDPWGMPVTDAHVTLLGLFGRLLVGQPALLPSPAIASDCLVAATDDRGVFHISGVAKFPVTLSVRKEGYVQPEGDLRLTAPPGHVRITLAAYLRVGIRAVDGDTQEPVDAIFVAREATVRGITSTPFAPMTMPPGVAPTGHNPGSGEVWATFAMLGDEGERPTRSARMRVESPGYVPQVVDVPLALPSEDGFRRAHVVQLSRSVSRSACGMLVVNVLPAATAVGSIDSVVLRIRPWDPGARASLVPYYWLPLASGVGRLVLPAGRYEVGLEGATDWIYHAPPRSVQGVDISAGAESAVHYTLEYGIVRLRAALSSGEAWPKFQAHIFRKVRGSWRQSSSVILEQALSGDQFNRYRRSFRVDAESIEVPLQPGEYAVALADDEFGSELQPFHVAVGETTDVVMQASPRR